MISFSQFMFEFAGQLDDNPEISKKELDGVERELDSLFKSLNIDIVFTKHFLERLNDKRNRKQVTINELVGVYLSLYMKHGKKLSKTSGDNEQRDLIKSINTNINIPVQVEYDSRKREVVIIAKTLMRNHDFKNTWGKVLKVD